MLVARPLTTWGTRHQKALLKHPACSTRTRDSGSVSRFLL